MSQFLLLRSRRFLPLFIVQFLGAFNDNVFRFALIIFITFTIADRSGIDARSLVVISGGIFILPFFLFSSLAGQIADKCEKATIIRRVKFVEILVMAAGAIGFWLQHTGFLLCVLFAMGMQSTFFGPLKYGILPQHLDEQELTGGNGLIQLGTYAAILLGAVTGGMLAAVEGLGPVPVVSCIVALAISGWIAAQYIPPAPPSDPALRINWNLPQATFRLLHYAFANREILTLILAISWFWFLGATFLSMVPTYGKELLHANEQAVTLLNVAFTLGIGTGSLLCERFSRGRIELGLVPFACVGISVFAADFFLVGQPGAPAMPLGVGTFLLHAPAARAFLDLTLIGAFGALFIVPLYAALQARVEAARCARVMAALNVMNALFMVISALFTVGLFKLGMSIPGVFGAVAAMNLVAMALAVIALPEFALRVREVLRTAIIRRS